MKYYYLDGIEKKGPYTIDELLSRNLSSNTMVYREDKTNWIAFSEFEELNVGKSISDKNISSPLSDNQINLEDVKDNIDSTKIKLPKNTFLILYMVASIGLSAFITYLQQKKDYEKISNDLKLVFKDKTSISDYYINDRLDGKLYDVVFHKADKNSFFSGDNFVTANEIRLATSPYLVQGDDESYLNGKLAKEWALFKDLNQYFIKDKYVDGFEAVNLWRSSDVFTIITYLGGDMAYKVPEKIHKNGTSFGGFSTPGYDIPTYRPTIKNCYIGAAEFLTKEDKDSTYVPGSYSKILEIHLGYYKNDFYEIKQIGDKYFRWSDTIHVIRPDGTKSYVIDDEKITASTSRNDGHVFNSDWVVWYKKYYNRYSLEPKKWAFLIYFSIYSVIGIILSFIINFIIKNRKRIVINQN